MPGLDGARRTAADALQAVRHARPGEVVAYAEIELSVLLQTGDGWSDFASARLGELMELGEGGRELIHTLAAYLQAGRNAKQAAERLQIHRNTLLYRLRRIEQRLDVSLTDPEVLFELDLATRIIGFTSAER